jgi:hypothetical protein
LSVVLIPYTIRAICAYKKFLSGNVIRNGRWSAEVPIFYERGMISLEGRDTSPVAD